MIFRKWSFRCVPNKTIIMQVNIHQVFAFFSGTTFVHYIQLYIHICLVHYTMFGLKTPMYMYISIQEEYLYKLFSAMALLLSPSCFTRVVFSRALEDLKKWQGRTTELTIRINNIGWLSQFSLSKHTTIPLQNIIIAKPRVENGIYLWVCLADGDVDLNCRILNSPSV